MLPKRFRGNVLCSLSTGLGAPDAWEVAMPTLPRTRRGHYLAYVIAAAALAAGVLIAPSWCHSARRPRTARRPHRKPGRRTGA